MTASNDSPSQPTMESPFAFDRETALVPTGNDRWTTTIQPHWNIDTNPNGGYAISAMVRAATGATEGHPDPLAITTQFLSSPKAAEDADIELERLRSGRRITSLRIQLRQQGKLRLSMIATMGNLQRPATLDSAPNEDRSIDDVAAPTIEPPEECADRSKLDQGVDLPLLSRVDVRLAPNFVEPGKDSSARMVGWIRLRDGRPTDASALPLFCDAFPPSVFSLWGQIGWVPTVELTVHVRRRPAPGWILAEFETRDLANGLLIEDGTLWDETGSVVARSRQLALLI